MRRRGGRAGAAEARRGARRISARRGAFLLTGPPARPAPMPAPAGLQPSPPSYNWWVAEGCLGPAPQQGSCRRQMRHAARALAVPCSNCGAARHGILPMTALRDIVSAASGKGSQETPALCLQSACRTIPRQLWSGCSQIRSLGGTHPTTAACPLPAGCQGQAAAEGDRDIRGDVGSGGAGALGCTSRCACCVGLPPDPTGGSPRTGWCCRSPHGARSQAHDAASRRRLLSR